MAHRIRKTEMKGDRARFCTRAEAKEGADVVRRRNDKRAVVDGLLDDPSGCLLTQDEIEAGHINCTICDT